MTPSPTTAPAAGRRRSGAVALGMVGTLALALTSCSSSGSAPRRCVDPGSLKVLDNHSCTDSRASGRWYYCDSGSLTAAGGTFDQAATKRGGFGCPSGSGGG
ncbi:hypothetical protein [Kitasatospora sp. McL0602]|uniref:hypothetical protein n=1 Tax=Kitasatospora sp. McL0602 TaxID=3439530 RepID=UPI003F888AAB